MRGHRGWDIGRVTNETYVWRTQAYRGGWLRMTRYKLVEGVVSDSETDSKAVVYLRVERSEQGGLEVREAAMTSRGPIDAHSWKDVPFVMAMAAGAAPPGASFPGFTADEWMSTTSGQPFSLSEALEAEFKSATGQSPGMLIGAAPGAPTPLVGALKAPTGNLTDEFLAELAGAYRELVAIKRNPGPAIADQTGAPVATVRRWISVARKRGFLPPATRGRAG